MNLRYSAVLYTLFAWALCCQAQTPNLCDLSIQIHNVRNAKGTLRVQLEDSRAVTIATQAVAPQKGTVTLRFEGIQPGQYAVTLLHDENDNQKMDLGLIGIPKEGWACSNDARAFMAAPKLKDKLFRLDQHHSIQMKMVYY